MKYLGTILLGALLGSLIALLFAPYKGEELRSSIANEANTQYARGKDEWQKVKLEVQRRVQKSDDGQDALITETVEME